MNFLHYDFQLSPDDSVEVVLDKAVNVRLLDELNFQKYRDGQEHKYYGGLAKISPVRLRPPHAGHWHLVIDLGGFPGTVNASVHAIKAASLQTLNG
jgi:hypothetical protein